MRPYRIKLALSIAVAVAFTTQAGGQATVRGVVFADLNGNGSRDIPERGIPDVVVSNQDVVVTTDTAGRYEIAVGPSGLVYVSVPDNFRAVGAFWRAVDGTGPIAFALQPSPQPRNFTFIHASDTHLSAPSLARMQRFRFLADSTGAALTLITGDLIRDAMSQPDSSSRAQFELFVSELRQFRAPAWTVPGNHDHFGIVRSRNNTVSTSHPLYNRGMYRRYLGPDYYSFTYGGVHFIGLNTVQTDDSAYYGGVDSVQLAWLTRDVATVPAGMPIVTFDHIPFSTGADMLTGYIDIPFVPPVARPFGKPVFRHTVWNALDVLRVAMEGHPVLALGGHTHIGEKVAFETPAGRVRFEQSSAIIGGGQAGPIIVPSGFTLYTVRAGEIDPGVFVPMDRKPGG